MGGIYKVNKTSGELSQISGGTLYADLPVGSWIKNDMGTIPNGFLKEGDTISQSEYPDLYAKYGSTVPYMADTSEPSDWEDITIGTTNVTMAYDGFVIGKWNLVNNRGEFTVNDTILFATSNASSGVSEVEIPVKKGDTIKQTGSNTSALFIKARYYKKSLIVKAKNIGAPENLVESVRDALQYNVQKLVDTINYAKTDNYCTTATSTNSGMTVPFDRSEYSDGNYIARIHTMVARKTNSGDLYFKTFIDIPIATGTDPNTGLTIKSYGFIPDWSESHREFARSGVVYYNGIEVFMEEGTYSGETRDVIGLWYKYETYTEKNVIVYMPSAVGFIANSDITTYIEKVEIFKLD